MFNSAESETMRNVNYYDYKLRGTGDACIVKIKKVCFFSELEKLQICFSFVKKIK
jgi:hypothetical protein